MQVIIISLIFLFGLLLSTLWIFLVAKKLQINLRPVPYGIQIFFDALLGFLILSEGKILISLFHVPGVSEHGICDCGSGYYNPFSVIGFLSSLVAILVAKIFFSLKASAIHGKSFAIYNLSFVVMFGTSFFLMKLAQSTFMQFIENILR